MYTAATCSDSKSHLITTTAVTVVSMTRKEVQMRGAGGRPHRATSAADLASQLNSKPRTPRISCPLWESQTASKRANPAQNCASIQTGPPGGGSSLGSSLSGSAFSHKREGNIIPFSRASLRPFRVSLNCKSWWLIRRKLTGDRRKTAGE